MTRGFRHPTATFSKITSMLQGRVPGRRKISRLPPFVGLVEAPENLSFGPPSQEVSSPYESPKTAFNALMFNLLNLRMSNLFLTLAV